jgi:hypothetical protein
MAAVRRVRGLPIGYTLILVFAASPLISVAIAG